MSINNSTMENMIQKCSSKEHEKIDAKIYCRKCEIYMCSKCESIHSNLCQNHQIFNLEKNNEELFTGFCKEENHNNELEYYCKNHNQLCCAACIAKIQKNKNGIHKDCDVCLIEEIKDEKKKKLKENIKLLNELSKSLDESINKLKEIVEKINENKENLKLNIQKIFTKIRNELNNREDELLLEVEEKYENIYFKNDIIKETEKLPNKIKISLEKGEIINKEDINSDNKLISLINDCINVEKNISEIKIINENIKKVKNFNNLQIKFIPEKEEETSEFLEIIKKFGKINCIDNHISEFDKSSIIKNDIDMIQLIMNWIKEKTNKDNIKFELIFKMSENGSKSKDFHKYCDNKGSTLTIIKTTKNQIFGGFTPLEWNINGGYLKDESNQTFLFSLNLKKNLI